MNTLELAKGRDNPKSRKAVVQPTITHKTLAREDEKVVLVLFGSFDKQAITTSIQPSPAMLPKILYII